MFSVQSPEMNPGYKLHFAVMAENIYGLLKSH